MRQIYRKKDGFKAQKAIVLPPAVIKVCEQHEIISNLHITDIGYYPKAQYHYRDREHGSSQNILIYCIDGKGWLKINGKKIEVEKGSFLIIPRNTRHTYGADDEKPWSIFWIHFKGRIDAAFLKELKKDAENIHGTIDYDERRLEVFNEMYSILSSGYSLDNLVYVNIRLSYFLSTFCYPHIFNVRSATEETETEIAIRFMKENITQPLNINQLAKEVHLSPSHFCSIFKKKTGYPPMEYFNHIKMQHACQLLEFSNKLIKELAFELGYTDQYYFSRFFSKYMGQSPVEYRKRKKILQTR